MPARIEGNVALAEDWRAELAGRVEAHRARRRRRNGASGQPELNFVEETVGTFVYQAPPAPPACPAPAAQPPRHRRTQGERMEIDIAQTSLDFEPHHASAGATQPRFEPPFPVAPLTLRIRAGAIDAALLLFSYGGFVALFAALGGRFTPSTTSLTVVTAMFGLFCVLYVALFAFLGGATPGMMLCGLVVVNFDGAPPKSGQLLWRVFGYVICSATAMLGFLWALWDENHLAWYDRVSRTYLTQQDDSMGFDHPGRAPAPHSAKHR